MLKQYVYLLFPRFQMIKLLVRMDKLLFMDFFSILEEIHCKTKERNWRKEETEVDVR